MPTTVSFRYTDILRGYVAQRLLWHIDRVVGFAGASVWQDRNEHDLMVDFADEVEMYTSVEAVVAWLEEVALPDAPLDGLVAVYEGLAQRDIVQPAELDGVRAWATDLRRLGFA